MYVLPPIVRVGVKPPAPAASADDDDEVATPAAKNGSGSADMDTSGGMDAYARNLSANSSASPLQQLRLNLAPRSSGGDEEGATISTPVAFTLPRKLHLFSTASPASPDHASTIVTSPLRLPSTSSNVSTPSSAAASAAAHATSTPSPMRFKPKLGLGLNLRGITSGGDDEEADSGMQICAVEPVPQEEESEISTIPVIPYHRATSVAGSPQHAAAAAASAAGESSIAASVPPFLPYSFPEFASGPVACSRHTLVSPGIFVLHGLLSGALWVWMPPPGQIFIPSKYEGDREQFAGDIARSYQLTLSLQTNSITSVTVEQAGKESDAFLQALSEGANYSR